MVHGQRRHGGGRTEDQQWAGMRRLEFGIQHGALVVGVFDGSGPDPVDWHTFDSDAPLGPVTIGVRRIAGEFVVPSPVWSSYVLPIPACSKPGGCCLGGVTNNWQSRPS
jgi:hypothetical protein